jgi:hypothetical protein
MKYETYTFDENILSDLHKDAYGFRPSGDFFREWDLLDSDGKQDLWEQLIDAVRDSIREEKRYHQEAIANLEDRIRFMMSTIIGCQREDAIRYLHDVYNTHGDIEYLEHHLGVPYGYLSGKNWG